MRPKSIVIFERLFLAGTAFSILSILLYYGAWRDLAISRGEAAAGPLIGIVLAGFMGWLFWFFIVRRSSKLVKWLLCIAVVFTAIELPESIEKGRLIGTGYLMLFAAGTFLQSAAPLLLFRKDAREWFRHKGQVPEPISDVFG
jgi:hypothetical protein